MTKRAYITHVTEEYLPVARNLGKSLKLFSDLNLLIYVLNAKEKSDQFFSDLENVKIRNINLNLENSSSNDYTFNPSGNFYIDRSRSRIYKILCAKTLAMEMALEEGYEEICYLDSDCIATPVVDELFNWMNLVTDYPIGTAGIHEYMIIIESNGYQRGNPFENTWPEADHKKTLEWPLMEFLQMPEGSRGNYRTTGIMLMNKNCLPFIKIWSEFCFILPKLNLNLNHLAAYHEETIYNVLSWKKTNIGFPLCYINLREGLTTTKHFYEEGQPGFSTWMTEENPDYSLNFYSIPPEKRNVKVLHGEKRSDEADLILQYLTKLKDARFFESF